MNQLYFKHFFFGALIFATALPEISPAQSNAKVRHRDRTDLIADIHKVQLDHRKIANLKAQIRQARETKNRKALQAHRKKLALEKKILKQDYAHSRQEQKLFVAEKNQRISRLTKAWKESDQQYEAIRKKIRKDLAHRNDFSVQKSAGELMKAVQVRQETSTELAMEKSDLLTTMEAVENEWKKVRSARRKPIVNYEPPAPVINLSTVQ